MDRLVKLLAPTGPVDFSSKFIVISCLMGLVNYFRDRILTAHDGYHSFLNNYFEVLIVAAPFLYLALALLAHLNDLQKRLAHLAGTDVLTGLANRRTFMAKMGDVASRSGVLMMVDVDHFKLLNDRYGHDVGDLCLRTIAENIQQRMGASDFCARLGGEEFAIFMPDATLLQAHAVGQRIVAGVKFVPKPEAPEVTVTSSVGAVKVKANNNLDALLVAADKALYRAKAEGRARMLIWEDLHEAVLAG
ncbi:GGDEF domain-containing protein [Yoonia sp. MH D7]